MVTPLSLSCLYSGLWPMYNKQFEFCLCLSVCRSVGLSLSVGLSVSPHNPFPNHHLTGLMTAREHTCCENQPTNQPTKWHCQPDSALFRVVFFNCSVLAPLVWNKFSPDIICLSVSLSLFRFAFLFYFCFILSLFVGHQLNQSEDKLFPFSSHFSSFLTV